MAEAKIRIELDAEGAKRKLKRFDEDREKARKKTEKAEKRQAQRDRRDRGDGGLTSVAETIMAIKSPAFSVFQKRAEQMGSKIEAASKMVTKLTALITSAEAASDTMNIVAGALDAVGPAGQAIAGPLKQAASGLKASAVPRSLIEQARITAEAVAPFASAGIDLSSDQILQIRELAALQAKDQIDEEVRAKKKFGKVVTNVIADITGLGG